MLKNKNKVRVAAFVAAGLLLVAAAILADFPPQQAKAFSQPYAAADAIGENFGGDPNAAVDYFSWIANNGAGGGNPSAAGLDGPESLALDTIHHRLFVADSNNCRVLIYDLTAANQLPDRIPDNVLGSTTFDNTDPNWCTTSPTSMHMPNGVVYDDVHDRLFVSDEFENDLHIFDLSGGITNGMAASHVLGAADLNSDGFGTQDQYGMSLPEQMAYDATNDYLFVTDGWYDRRVLVFDLSGGISDGMAAAHVLGEPDFTTTSATPDQFGMDRPYGLAYDDAHKRLFVADILANRVTVFDLSAGISDGMAASNVLGQPDFTTYNTGFSAAEMNGPRALTYDPVQDRLFVSEQYNNRVTIFNLSGGISDGMPASSVIGQSDFSTHNCDTTQGSVCWPMQGAYDPATDTFWLADQSNNRVMIYAPVPQMLQASDVAGQTDYTSQLIGGGTDGLSAPNGIALDGLHHRLFVVDQNNCRVLEYQLNTDNTFTDHSADHVIGQPDMSTVTCGAPNSQSTFKLPMGAAYDPAHDRLYVADQGGGRILEFELSGGISDGMPASHVLGQSDFTTQSYPTTQNGDNVPEQIALDAGGNTVFISDDSSRVMVYDVSGGIGDGMNAVHVLGQPDFTSTGFSATQSTMGLPKAMVYDDTHKRLFVAEQFNNRVLEFDLSGGISDGMPAAHVLGQPDFTSGGNYTTRDGMGSPYGLAYDPMEDKLFVGDDGNARILEFDLSGGISDGMPASGVIAQPGWSFEDCDLSREGLCDAQGLAYDTVNRRLFDTDTSYNRVLVYSLADIIGSVANGTQGTAYNQSLAVYANGTPSYTVTSGSLPAGVVLDAATGLLSGTPTGSGSYNFDVTVADSVGLAGTFTTTRNYSLVVYPSGGGGPPGGGTGGGTSGSGSSGTSGTTGGKKVTPPVTPEPVTTPSQPTAPGEPTDTSDSSSNDGGKTVTASPADTARPSDGFFMISALRNFIRNLPEIAVRAFPWLLFVLLGLITLWSLWRSVSEARYVRKLAALVNKQRLLAEEKDTFVQLSAHYLRTPLTIIAGGVELAAALPGGAELAQKLQAPVEKLKSTADDILKQIKENVSLQQIAPVSGGEAKPSVFRTPQFWVPMALVGCAVAAADYLFAIWRNLNDSTIIYIEQSLVYGLIGLLLYGSIRRRYTTRVQRAKTEKLIAQQSDLDDARNIYIAQYADTIGEQVAAMRQAVGAKEHGTKAAEHIEKGIADLQETIDRFRLLSRLKTGQQTLRHGTVVLGSLVAEAGADLAAEAEANKVRVAAPAEQVSVVSDTDLLGTVVDSLVDNAVKYSAAGGTVTSDVQKRGGTVELSVHNDGTDISADKLNELFQPFVRAEGDALADFSKQGMGFSLYLDKIIMDYLDGSISATSEAGKGTTVSISLPG